MDWKDDGSWWTRKISTEIVVEENDLFSKHYFIMGWLRFLKRSLADSTIQLSEAVTKQLDNLTNVKTIKDVENVLKNSDGVMDQASTATFTSIQKNIDAYGAAVLKHHSDPDKFIVLIKGTDDELIDVGEALTKNGQTITSSTGGISFARVVDEAGNPSIMSYSLKQVDPNVAKNLKINVDVNLDGLKATGKSADELAKEIAEKAGKTGWTKTSVVLVVIGVAVGGLFIVLTIDEFLLWLAKKEYKGSIEKVENNAPDFKVHVNRSIPKLNENDKVNIELNETAKTKVSCIQGSYHPVIQEGSTTIKIRPDIDPVCAKWTQSITGYPACECGTVTIDPGSIVGVLTEALEGTVEMPINLGKGLLESLLKGLLGGLFGSSAGAGFSASSSCVILCVLMVVGMFVMKR